MKKHLSLILRLLVALLGIAYIVYVVDWVDTMELPPGTYTLQSGQTLGIVHTDRFRIVSGDFDPANISGIFEVNVTDAQGESLGILHVPARSLDPAPEPGRDVRLRPGLLTTLRHAELWLLLVGLLLVGPIYPLAGWRWWMLLKARGLDVKFGNAFRLTMVGCFFNYCMPGTTGGDVVKAFYAAKNSNRRPDAVMTVIIDRVVGLLGLIILAGIAGCFVEDPRVRPVMFLIWSMAGGAVVFSAVYFSRHLRAKLGLDWLLGKVLKPDGLLSRIEQAASAYAHHKGAVTASIAVSLVVHFLIATAGAMAGYALGMETPMGLMLAVIPVVTLVAALPISYQGFGFMEVLGIRLLATPGLANANQIVVMLLLIRLFQMFYSLMGSIYLLRGDIHMHPQQQGDGLSEEEAQAAMPAITDPSTHPQ